jgi:excinuclease ABC subunit B
MERAISETNRRRAKQVSFNTQHGITPQTIIKQVHDIMEEMKTDHSKAVSELMRLDKDMIEKNPLRLIHQKEKQMNAAVKILDFETAAILRDEIAELTKVAGKRLSDAEAKESKMKEKAIKEKEIKNKTTVVWKKLSR